MEDENLRKGLLYAVITGVLVSIMPIVIISRPQVIDQYIFAAMTFIIVSIIFLPLVLLERKVIKKRIVNDPSSQDCNELLLHGWKNHKKFFIYLGIVFGVGRIFLILGYELAGAINGALAQKTRIILALLIWFYHIERKYYQKANNFFNYTIYRLVYSSISIFFRLL